MILETPGFNKIERWLVIIGIWSMVFATAYLGFESLRHGSAMFPRLSKLEKNSTMFINRINKLEQLYKHRHNGIYGEAIFQEDSTEN